MRYHFFQDRTSWILFLLILSRCVIVHFLIPGVHLYLSSSPSWSSSLRGRRLKGKGKGKGARGTRGAREEGGNNGFMAGLAFPPSSRTPPLAYLSRLKLPLPPLSNACQAGYEVLFSLSSPFSFCLNPAILNIKHPLTVDLNGTRMT